MRLRHTEVCFFFRTSEMFFLGWAGGSGRNWHPAKEKRQNWNLWPLCIHSHVSLVFFALSNMKLLNFWKLIVCLIAWVCAVLLKDYPLTTQTVSSFFFLPSQNNVDVCSNVFICANLFLNMLMSRPHPLLYASSLTPSSFFFIVIVFFSFICFTSFVFVHFFYDSPSHNKTHQLPSAGSVVVFLFRNSTRYYCDLEKRLKKNKKTLPELHVL